MKLMRFNTKGIAAFQTLLDEVRRGAMVQTPLGITGDNMLTEPLTSKREFEVHTFETRHDLAAQIADVLDSCNGSDDMSDTGLWAWLSAVYFDSVCPADGTGYRVPRHDYRHIPSADWRNFYRHLIRGPVRIFRLFRENPDKAAIVLCQKPSVPGDFVEQLASRQERITNPGIIEAANRLYFDKAAQAPKRGAAPNWPKSGTLRRFGDLLNQLDLTYDLYSLSADELVRILPAEFSTYRL